MDTAEWTPVAPAEAVTTRPRAVTIDGVSYVVLRLAEGGRPVAFADHCPHRLVPLSAGTVDGGVLRCAYHGWEFAADGRCVALPSLGPDASPPPRAHLPEGPPVREHDGQLWLRRPAGPPEHRPADLLSNLEGVLARAWHPVALSSELGAQPRDVRLLGRVWTLRRTSMLGGTPYTAESVNRGSLLTAHGVRERWGLVWLAPEEPLVELFDEPDAEDEAYVGAWLPPATTSAPHAP